MKSFFNIVLILITTLIFCSCQTNTTAVTPAEAAHNKDSMRVGAYSFKTEGGWGYSIIVDDKVFIKQSNIPVVEGNQSFATEADALKVANEVISKIKLHKKPTLSKADLQKLGVIK